jgi:hypothetical protein
MTTEELITSIKTKPEKIEFDQVISVIDNHYHYTPTRFSNGRGNDQINNPPGCNEGSCKIFSFATLKGLTQKETLACFGEYFREDVMNHPDGNDHANIRTFMRYGWNGIQFEGAALSQDSRQ